MSNQQHQNRQPNFVQPRQQVPRNITSNRPPPPNNLMGTSPAANYINPSYLNTMFMPQSQSSHPMGRTGQYQQPIVYQPQYTINTSQPPQFSVQSTYPAYTRPLATEAAQQPPMKTPRPLLQPAQPRRSHSHSSSQTPYQKQKRKGIAIIDPDRTKRINEGEQPSKTNAPPQVGSGSAGTPVAKAFKMREQMPPQLEKMGKGHMVRDTTPAPPPAHQHQKGPMSHPGLFKEVQHDWSLQTRIQHEFGRERNAEVEGQLQTQKRNIDRPPSSIYGLDGSGSASLHLQEASLLQQHHQHSLRMSLNSGLNSFSSEGHPSGHRGGLSVAGNVYKDRIGERLGKGQTSMETAANNSNDSSNSVTENGKSVKKLSAASLIDIIITNQINSNRNKKRKPFNKILEKLEETQPHEEELGGGARESPGEGINRHEGDMQHSMLQQDKTKSKSQGKEAAVHTAEDISALKFLPHEKTKLASCKVFALVVVGDSLAGKTSMLKTLIQGKSYLAPWEKRTIVAKILSWIPQFEEDIVYLMYDLGGQRAYRSTCYCFQMNAPSSVCILVHEITSKKYKSTFEWLKDIQRNAPESHILVALTQVDKVENESDRQDKVEAFVKQFVQLCKEEIDVIMEQRKSTKESKKKKYDKHIENYRAVISLLLNGSLLLLSSAPTHESTLDGLRKYLLKFAVNTDDAQVLLSELEKQLLMEIGTLGLREPLLQHDKPLSWPDNSGESAIETPDVPDEKVQQYLTISQVAEIYHVIAHRLGITVEDPEAEVKEVVINLSNKGFLRYFTGEHLEKIVFNNFSTLITILTSIFHHHLLDMLQLEFTDFLPFSLRNKLYGNKEKQFKGDVTALTKFGIVTRSMLEVLLFKINCSIDVEAIASLLERLNFGINFKEAPSRPEVTFVPFLSKKALDEEDLQGYVQEVSKYSDQVLSLHSVLRGNLVDSFFHALLVKVFQHFGRNQTANRQNFTWEFVAWIEILEKNVKFLIHYHSDKGNIDFYIQGDISSLEAHDFLMQCLSFVYSASTDVQQSRHPGLVIDHVLLCTDCKLPYDSRCGDITDACEWDVEDLLNEPHMYYKCEHSKERIPGGLLAPISSDDHSKSKQDRLDEVKEYLGRRSRALQEKKQPSVSTETKEKALVHLPSLCNACKIKVANKTMDDSDVRDIWTKLGLGDFLSISAKLDLTMLTTYDKQQIAAAKTDCEASSHFEQSFWRSRNPKKMEEFLNALLKIERKKHSDDIKRHLFKYSTEHKKCKECLDMPSQK